MDLNEKYMYVFFGKGQTQKEGCLADLLHMSKKGEARIANVSRLRSSIYRA